MHGPKKRGPAPAKPKNTGATVKRLIKYIAKEKALLIGMIVLVIVSSAATVCASLFIQPLIDELLVNIAGQKFSIHIFDPVKKYFVFMILVFLLGVITSYGRSKCSVFLTQRTLRRLRKELFDSVADLPIGFYDSRDNVTFYKRC